jgi:predicted O-linked N-acetylglucosamine transferase (SPINDLY family)
VSADAGGEAQAAYAAGQAAARSGDLAGAADHFRRATVLDPQSAIAQRELGIVEFARNRFFESEAANREALRLNPNLRSPHLKLATILALTGRNEAALALLHELLAHTGNAPDVYSDYLFLATRSGHRAREAVFAEHVRFGEQLAAKLPPPLRHDAQPNPDRRLKLAYVSADVGQHILALMLEPALKGHDRSRFEVFLYDNAVRAQPRRLSRDSVDHWVEVADLDDEALVQRVRADGIDILVDLSGHTGGNRLPAFARRPAPVQISWLGYPFTTGLRAVDYRICDARQIGPGTAFLLVEEPFIVPGASVAFLPPDEPAPAPPPCLANGYLTFGSANALSKIDDTVLDLWAEILRAIPTSRLLMKAHGLHDARLQKRFTERFAQQGVAPERVTFEGASGVSAFLQSFSRMDIALDAFPYTGGSTTRYTLWMGVPLVTLEGVALYERFSGAILRELDLAECVAPDPAAYVAAAAALAGDTARLAELRRDLRPRMRASSLCDVAGQGRRLEDAYREMWRRWCARQPADPRTRRS